MMSGSWSVVNNANYSLVFGQNVTITKNYETAFYSTTAPGVVRITDILILTPRNSFPSPAEEGMIVVAPDPRTNVRHIWCYLRGDWRQLDN